MEKYSEGPYNLCLRCEHLGDGCDGPNTLSMSLERWCAWCKDLKALRGLTNAQITELSGVSLTTIERIMAGTISKDIMRSTASDINRVLVGSAGKWPCSLASQDETPGVIRELESKTAELRGLRKALEEIHASYQKEMDAIRAEAQTKVNFLKVENARLQKLLDAKDEAIARKDETIARKDAKLSVLLDKLLSDK